MQNQRKKAGVFVLGPLDRSPRMMNHAISMCENTKYKVDLIGYKGKSKPRRLLEHKDQIKLVHIDTEMVDKLKDLPRYLYLFYGVLRIIIQVFQLMVILIQGRYDVILLQNPPCIPIFFVIWLFKLLQRLTGMDEMRVIVDWHNYGYTIMEANQVRSPIVYLGRVYERFFGRMGDQHLCVSQAFKADLVSNFGLPEERISVLYDRAVEGKFKVLSIQEKHDFLKEINMGNMITVPSWCEIVYREDRPLLLITSTSYTPDENLDILIEALELYAKKALSDPTLPSLYLVVTGKGPLKSKYIIKFDEFNDFKGYGKVTIEPKWLKMDEYPKMVAVCDLGICVHMSSSNLDLPMKVVDMFSCKVPCFAYDYPTIGELVESQKKGASKPNGETFKTPQELFELFLLKFGDGIEASVKNLETYRKNLDKFVGETWDEHWKEVMLFQKSKGCLFGKDTDKKIIKK